MTRINALSIGCAVCISAMMAGCSPAQMQPVRDAATQVRMVADKAEAVSDVGRLTADAAELAADLANIVSDCEQRMSAAPPPDLLGVHPCVWDMMTASQAAVHAIEALVSAAEALSK